MANPELHVVVHIVEGVDPVEQVTTSLACGASGVFLIDHYGYSGDRLFAAFGDVVAAHPSTFVGVNLLGAAGTTSAFRQVHAAVESGAMLRLPDAIWVDAADHDFREVVRLRQEHPELRQVTYFGGVAFKYTRTFTDDPVDAAHEARRLTGSVDVITTSGAATGVAPTTAKLGAIRAACPDVPLAMASGVDASNIAELAPFVDHVLVASSIETRPGSGVIDPDKLNDLVIALRRSDDVSR